MLSSWKMKLLGKGSLSLSLSKGETIYALGVQVF